MNTDPAAEHRLPWKQDQTWTAAGWAPTAMSPLRVAAMADPARTLREPHPLRRGLAVWAVLLGAASLGTAVGGFFAWQDVPLQVAGTAVLLALLDGLLGVALVSALSRRLWFDDAGVADGDFFRIRRVPWSAIVSFERINTSQALQDAHDADFRRPGHHRHGRMRPPSVYEWTACDARGRLLLRLPSALENEPAFPALCRQLGGRVQSAPSPLGVGAQDRAEHRLPSDAHDAALASRNALQRRVAGCLLAAMLVPFVVGTALATARAAWFVLAAERAEGTVVAKPPGTLPSLVVAYAPPGGAALQIESGRSPAYSGIQIGDRLTVFHDAEQPDDARLDLFLELWLGPLAGAAFTLLMAGVAALIWRALTRPVARLGKHAAA